MDTPVVVFQVNQVGNDTQATKFIHGLLRFRNVYCTSGQSGPYDLIFFLSNDFTELLDVKMESLKGNNLQLENWVCDRLKQYAVWTILTNFPQLVTRLTQGISPTPDSDE